MNYVLKTITSASCDLITAEDPVEAMSSLKTIEEIECVLIDIDYQTEQNLNFVLHLRDSLLYQCPVVILSSHKDIFDGDHPSNVESIFYKPFDPLDLKREIDKIMKASLPG
jgi:two-component SAPR family response regulator